MQYYFSFISIPWTIKIVYGLVSDNFPICGSHRRAYIILGALMQLVFMTLMALNCLEQFDQGPAFATVCLTMGSMSVAMSDVIIDSLMVIQSRQFPKDGAEELQTYSW